MDIQHKIILKNTADFLNIADKNLAIIKNILKMD